MEYLSTVRTEKHLGLQIALQFYEIVKFGVPVVQGWKISVENIEVWGADCLVLPALPFY